MKPKDIREAGIPAGKPLRWVQAGLGQAAKAGLKKKDIEELLRQIAAAPAEYLQHPFFGAAASAMLESPPEFVERQQPAPYRQWGQDLDELSLGAVWNRQLGEDGGPCVNSHQEALQGSVLCRI